MGARVMYVRVADTNKEDGECAQNNGTAQSPQGGEASLMDSV